MSPSRAGQNNTPKAASTPSRRGSGRVAKRRVRIIKKIRIAGGLWRFISLDRIGDRYVWDKRPGYYFLEWWDGKNRRRERAGVTPSEAAEAQRRKQHELIGELLEQGGVPPTADEASATRISDAVRMFSDHVRTHSPGKPETLRRYEQVLGHFERASARKKYVEAITRADIDEYKTRRSTKPSEGRKRPVTPRTINFEVSTLRTFFYYLIHERGIPMLNPCAHFKPLKDERKRAKRKPSVYTQEELDKLFAKCDHIEKAIFATLLLTGLRKRELYFLMWGDIDLKRATIRVTGEGKDGFSPKDYEERIIPIPPDLVLVLKTLPRRVDWVFPNQKGDRLNHLLRYFKEIASRAGIGHATLHKFRHTYATRLLEKGSDIVTVQHLLGHSDLETTRQYLNPDDSLKRKAVSQLSLTG